MWCHILKHISREMCWLLLLAKFVIFKGCLAFPHMAILNYRVMLNCWTFINNRRNGNISATVADIQNKGERMLCWESLLGRVGALTPPLWTNMSEKPGWREAQLSQESKNPVPSRPASPPLIIEEVRFLGLNYDHIKQVPPVLPHDIPHAFVSGIRQTV